MNYDKAKKSFEYLVDKLQRDLKKYSSSEDANPKVIEMKLEIINTMVDFYNQVEIWFEEKEWQSLNSHMAYSKLRTDTQKLVYWCRIHQVSVNAIFHYEEKELEAILKSGVKFTDHIDNDDHKLLLYKYHMVSSFYGPRGPLFPIKEEALSAEQISIKIKQSQAYSLDMFINHILTQSAC